MAHKIMPPVYFLALLILAIGLHFAFPILAIIPAPYDYIGIALIILGIALMLWTVSIFRQKNTTLMPHGVPSHLVDFGPFKFSRNPIYLGMTCILLGTAITLGSLSPLISPLLFVLITGNVFIPVEEKNLEGRFGTRYTDFKRRVRRWI